MSLRSRSIVSSRYNSDFKATHIGEKIPANRFDTTHQRSFEQMVNLLLQDISTYRQKYMKGYISLTLSILILLLCSTNSYIVLQIESKIPREVRIVFKIINYIVTFSPDDHVSYISFTIHGTLLILYIAIVAFLFVLIHRYKGNSSPRSIDLLVLIIVSRCFLQVITPSLFLFLDSLQNLLSSSKLQTKKIIQIIISVPIIIINIILYTISASVSNATPKIKRNVTSIWFSFNRYVWYEQLVKIAFIFVQTFIILFEEPYNAIFSFIVNFIILSYLCFYTAKHLPFVKPSTNLIYVTAYAVSIFFSLFPIIAYYASDLIIYFLIGFVFLSIPFYFIFKFIISIRIKKVVSSLESIYTRNTNEDENASLLIADQISYTGKTNFEQFDKLGISTDQDFSFYLRIGYLYKLPCIEDGSFIRYAIECSKSTDTILTAAQVATSAHGTGDLLFVLERMIGKINEPPIGFKNFTILFNRTRQERLTQFNEPLLKEVERAKTWNLRVQEKLGDFWGAILKQRDDLALMAVPEIAFTINRAQSVTEQLLRMYPKSPLANSIIVLFKDKSIGNHFGAIKLRKDFERADSSNRDEDYETTAELKNLSFSSSESDSETSSSNITIEGEDYKQSVPWIAAEKAIDTVPSPAKRWLILSMTITFITMLSLPVVLLITSHISMNKVQGIIQPIESLSNYLHAICRLPQLIRRKELFMNSKIHPWDEDTGPPLGSLLEFLTEDDCMASIKKYISVIASESKTIVKLCQSGQLLHSYGTESIYDQYLSGLTKKANLQTISTVFSSYAQNLLTLEDSDWSDVTNTEAGAYIVLNFEVMYNGFNGMLGILMGQLPEVKKMATKDASIISIIALGMVFILCLPFLIYSLWTVKAEIRTLSKMIFQVPKMEISALRMSSKATKKPKNSAMNNGGNQSYAGSSTFEASQEQKFEMMSSILFASRKQHPLISVYVVENAIFVLFSIIFAISVAFIFKNSLIDMVQISIAYVQSIDVASSALASYVWTQDIFAEGSSHFTVPVLKEKGKTFLHSFMSSYDGFLFDDGNDSDPGILLGNDVINNYLKSKSTIVVPNKTILPVGGFIHNVYFAMSCDSQIRMLDAVSLFVLGDIIDPFTFDDLFVYHYEHLLFCHIDGFLQTGMNLFKEIVDSEDSSTLQKMIMVLLLLMVCQILYFFTVVSSQAKKLFESLNVPRSAMKLISPAILLKTVGIVRWLSGCKKDCKVNLEQDNKRLNAASDFAVKQTKCGIIILNEDEKITSVNANVLDILIINEEEAIGKTLDFFLNKVLIEKDKSYFNHRLQKEIKRMRNGTGNKYVFESTVLTDTKRFRYVSVTIEGHPESEEGGPARSFTAVLLDRTKEHFQDMLVESEKKKCQTLIDSILPPSISKLLKDGETDITFEVRQATVIFASIYEWGDLISNMSSGQVVRLLNKIFSAFDSAIVDFPDITKIKTIGHIYMVATGLFSEPNANTTQTSIDFALRMLESVKKISEEEHLHIDMTIGINTSGPVNCGILGVTRPLFDIIGDPVNVASRLNSLGVPGFIQIAQGTYEKIKFLKYSVRDRGVIAVKGKGNMNTYLIS